MDFKIDFSGTWTGGIPAVGALDFALLRAMDLWRPLLALCLLLFPGLGFGQGATVTCLLHESFRWNSVTCGCGHLSAGPDLSTPSNSPSSSKTKPQPPRYSFLPSSFLPCGRVSSIDLLFFARNQTDYWVSNDDPVIIFLVPFSAPLSSPKCLNGSLTCML